MHIGTRAIRYTYEDAQGTEIVKGRPGKDLYEFAMKFEGQVKQITISQIETDEGPDFRFIRFFDEKGTNIFSGRYDFIRARKQTFTSLPEIKF